MISRIEIENFYSVRQAQNLDLRVADNVPETPGRFGEVCPGSKERVPKVVALFGPNASGKSTVLRALAFMAWFVQSSFQLPPDAPQPCESFNDKEAGQLPTRLAIHFGAPANLIEPRLEECSKYVYEVSFSAELGKPKAVISEALRQWSVKGGKPVRLFERDEHGAVRYGKGFGLSGYRQVISKVRANASLIATLAQFDHKPSLLLQRLAASIASNIFIEKVDFAEDSIVRFYAQHPELVEALNREIERIDLGIKGMSIDSASGGPVAKFEHEGLDRLMPMQLESHGTRQFIRIFPMLIQTLTVGGVAVIDELDLAIHPIVLPEILRWFYDPIRNPQNAQLWMSCHNASLLDDLIKEEVYFCEKDSRGRTRVYGLQDIQSVRRNDNYYQKYLGGVYGAVPQLG
jgi:energy-coupling factor transporter ATP-binding protein EcfA2